MEYVVVPDGDNCPMYNGEWGYCMHPKWKWNHDCIVHDKEFKCPLEEEPLILSKDRKGK